MTKSKRPGTYDTFTVDREDVEDREEQIKLVRELRNLESFLEGMQTAQPDSQTVHYIYRYYDTVEATIIQLNKQLSQQGRE